MTAGLQVGFTEMGVEECDSPTWSGDGENQTLTRKFLVEGYDDAMKARWQLLGHAELDDDGVLTRWLPQEDWDFPKLYASKVEMKGLAWCQSRGGDDPDAFGTTNEFKKYVLQTEFTPRPYPILEDWEIIAGTGGTANEFLRFVEPVTTMEGQYLSVPSTGVLKWAEGSHATTPPTPIPANIGKIVCEENYVFRWHMVPDAALPETAILNTVGKVNKTDFGDPNTYRLYFPANKLIMLGAGWRRVFMPKDASPAWVIEYMFKYKKTYHNNLFDYLAAIPDWYQVSLRGPPAFPPGSIPDGQCIYDEAEYADLFVPEPP